MKRPSIYAYIFSTLLLLCSGAVIAGNDGGVNNPPNGTLSNTSADSSHTFSNVEVWVKDSGFFGGCSGQRIKFSATGGCTNFDEDTGYMVYTTTSIKKNITMTPGGTLACYVHYESYDDCDTWVNTTQKIKVNQVVTVVNPGAKDDVDPDYVVNVTAKTADGITTTLDGSTNLLTYQSLTPSVCSIASSDVNSVTVHNELNGICTIQATASGNDDIQGPVSATASWEIINTRYPALAIVQPVGAGLTPSFILSSSQAGSITVGGSCSASAQSAIVGNNEVRLNALTLGNTYSDCTVSVTNAESLTSTIDIPSFKVFQNVAGPGGVGGDDGSSGTTLWLRGDVVVTSGSNVTTWPDQSGSGNDFSGGNSPTTSTLNGFGSVTYDGGNNYLTASANLDARSLFIVYKDTSTTSWATPFSSSSWSLMHGHSDDSQIFNATYTNSSTLNGTSYANGVSIDGLTHARPDSYEIDSHVFQSNYSGSATWYLGRDQYTAEARVINGGIAELIVLSSAVNQAQRIIVENYLASKYNVGLSANSIYTYGGSGAYKYDVAGIGQASDGSQHLASKGSMVEIGSPIGLANGEYLFWGHNNGALSFQTTDVDPLLAHRLTRVWRIRNTGAISAADVSIHIAELTGFMDMCFDPNNVRLLIDTDGTFASGSNIRTGTYDPLSHLVTFTNVSLPNGSYLTIGIGGSNETVFVSKTGAGVKDGSTWANACTLDGALASPRIPGDIVKMAEGVYLPESTISINTGITIQGGYAGVDESEVSNPEMYPTIISGDTDRNDDAFGDVVMYHRDINGSNLTRLFNIKNVATPVTLDGFTVTAMSQGPPVLSPGNHASAVWQQSSTVNYSNMRFLGNRARELGGALLVYNNSVANITGSEFTGNAGEHGGAINAHMNSTVNVDNSNFTGNEVFLLNNRSANPSVFSEGAALSFNGTDNKVTTSSSVPTNTFTFEAWVKTSTTHEIDTESDATTTGTSGQHYVFGAAHRGTDSGAGLSVGTNGISVYEHGSGYMPPLAVYSGSLGTGWNHIAIVYNNKTPSIYLNGTLVHTGLTSPRTTVYAPYEIGGGSYGWLAGEIDEVRVWNVARTEAQIQSYMYKEITDPAVETGLTGYWRFNNDVADSSGNANNGSLSTSAPTYVSSTIPSDPSATAWDRSAGGAIDVNNGSALTVTGSVFTRNTATDTGGIGGAISLSQNGPYDTPAKNNASISISTTTFEDNSALNGGGAIHAMPGFNAITVAGSKFVGNKATSNVTTNYPGSGGAIAAQGSPTSGQGVVSITDTEFESNSAYSLGGAVYFAGRYPSALNRYLDVSISRSTFVENTANYGAGFFAWQFTTSSTNNALDISNSTFYKNVASYYGGAIAAVNGADLAVSHTTIYKNIAGTEGGAIRIRDAGSSLAINNSLLIDNDASGSNGKNIHNTSVSISGDYNILGYNGASGWYDQGTNNQAPTANSFVAPATDVAEIINKTLTYNGGTNLTRTFALSSNGGVGSDAFNQVPIVNCLSEDQRGEVREAVGLFVKCDIGSFETPKVDNDSDGIVDALDNCPNHVNVDQSDIDGDNAGDLCDDDRDGDGVLNEDDYYPEISLQGRLDSDGDGIPDECDSTCISEGMVADTDVDGDTVANTSDNCPSVDNPSQNDVDLDGLGDACDDDMDGDGLVNAEDNCPSIANPDQADSNGNGLGDVCNAIFVKPYATGLGDCTSWDNACAGGTGTELQAAIDLAFAESASMVFMSEGIYRPSAAIVMKRGIALYGGFSGVDEQYHYQSEPDVYVTVVTGDDDNDDTVDANGVTQSYTHQNSGSTNLINIFKAQTLGTLAESGTGLHGLVITGAAESALKVQDSRVRISNVKFVGNDANAGAGLYVVDNGRIVAEDTVFSGNHADDGAAMKVLGVESEVSLTRTTFSNNVSAGPGGAISIQSSDLTIVNSLFQDNESSAAGGAIYADDVPDFVITGTTLNGNRTLTTTAGTGGGAISVQGLYESFYVGNTEFIENTSALNAGALMVFDDADDGTGAKVVTIEDTLFDSNQTIGASRSGGGAIVISGSLGQTTVDVSRSSFVSNSAKMGGAIQVQGGSDNLLNVDNSTFYGNTSVDYGGALGVTAGADATILHVTFTQNSSTGNGGAVRVDSTSSVLDISNSLLIDNTGAQGANISMTGTHTYTDGGYNIIGFNGVSGLQSGGVSNAIPAAPSFVATAASVDEIINPVLIDYSGAFKSIALVADSEARDVIPNGVNGCITDGGYDERGFDRPDKVNANDPDQDGDIRACDIGAFEFNNAYRVDCYAEDGLRPDGGSGVSLGYCPDGNTTDAAEVVSNIIGSTNMWTLLLLSAVGVAGLFRERRQV